MRVFRALAIAAVSGVVVWVAWFAGMFWFLGPTCGNELLAEVASPDGELRAVVFQRDCGATTGFSTQVSVLRRGEPLEDRPGNVFVADTGHGAAPSGPGGGPAVSARWLSSEELEVAHHPAARVFSSSPAFGSVKVRHVQAL